MMRDNVDVQNSDEEGYLFPLTLAQQRLWVLEQLQPGLTAYNLCCAYRLAGPLDRSLLRRSLEEITARHDSLRTTFAAIDGTPVQVVRDRAKVDLEYVDLTTFTPDACQRRSREKMEAEARRPFDLATGPLVRFILFCEATESHVLILTAHHIIADGWSLQIFCSELGAIYGAFATGQASPLPPLEVQFPDYAEWEREARQGKGLQDDIDYWVDTLRGAPPIFDLPFDHPRPVHPSHTSAVEAIKLPAALAGALEKVGKQHDATFFMVLLAAFMIFLYRWSGEPDIVVSTPIANRPQLPLHKIFGFLVDTPPVRAHFSDRLRFSAALGKVREAVLGMLAHPCFPFEQIAKELNYERRLDVQPLLQILFGVSEPVGQLSKAGDLVISMDSFVINQNAKSDLSLVAERERGSFVLLLRYDTELFEAATARRLLSSYAVLLSAIATDGDTRIDQFLLMTASERRRQLVDWNQTAVDYPSNKPVHRLFEQIALTKPNDIALQFGDTSISYRDLDQRANRLAQFIRRLGVGVETAVGVCLEASADLIIAFLATLKAGGYFVPLDPSFPANRLLYMIDNAQLSLLLTESGVLPPHPRRSDQVVYLNENREAIAAMDSVPPACDVSGRNLAYVMYTSGSTGRPKGAAIEHRSIVRLVRQNNFLRIQADDCVAFSSNVSFDASTLEIWGPLLNGARLIHVPRDVLLAPRNLTSFLRSQNVTVMWLTAGLFNQIARTEPGAFGSLRVVLTGGEAGDPQVWRQVLNACRGTGMVLINGYGPTENTVFSTTYSAGHLSEDAASVPIGRPIANSRAYILDDGLQPVPVGFVGELYVSGDGVGRGYTANPALTAERFLPDPYAVKPGERMYRTGDRVRYLEDGIIDFVGRVDDQVKIRGFRIEPAEIEAVLSRHPNVSTCFVNVWTDPGGSKRLVAYVVPRADQESRHSSGDNEVGSELRFVGELLLPNAHEMRNFIALHLPEYMLPYAIVALERLPLNASGKIDRHALPAPNSNRLGHDDTFVAPRTQNELILAAIWSDLLDIERVGAHDNFFQLGGDSILGIRVIARALEAGLRLTPRQLFQYQTVAQLAQAAETDTTPGNQSVIAKGAPLSPYQRSLLQAEATIGVPEWIGMVLDLNVPLQYEMLRSVLDALVAHHDALRMTLSENKLRVLSVNEMPSLYLEWDEPAETEAKSVDCRIHDKAAFLARGLDPTAAVMMRCAYLNRIDNMGGVLILVCHRLTVDRFSLAILESGLGTALQQRVGGRKTQLRRPLTSFAMWLQREKHRYSITHPEPITAPDSMSEKGGEPILDLSSYERRLGIEETRTLLERRPARYRVNSVEISVAAMLLALSSQTEEEVVVIEFHDQARSASPSEPDISHTVGCFVRLFRLQFNLKQAMTRRLVLAEVKDKLRALAFERLDNEPASVVNGLVFQPLISFSYESLGGSHPSSDTLVSRQILDKVGPRQTTDIAVMIRIENDRFKAVWTHRTQGHVLREQPSDSASDPTPASAGGRRRFSAEAANQLADVFIEELRALIDDCVKAKSAGYTRSDFPLSGLGRAAIEQIVGSDRNIDDLYPLSPMQQSMLIHTLAQPRSEVSFEQSCYLLAGRLNSMAFQRAWQFLADRHTILRSEFHWKGLKEPVQLVRSSASIPFEFYDWSALSQSEQQEELAMMLHIDRRWGFRMERAPLLRCILARLADDRHYFVFSYHHVLLDGWCLSLLDRELCQVYRAFQQDEPVELVPCRPYRDYIAWLLKQDKSVSEAYFRNQLADFDGPTPLRLGAPRDSVEGTDRQFDTRHLRLSSDLTSKLDDFCRRARLTQSTAVHAAWALVLGRIAQTDDVVFGTTASGRPADLPGVESIMGLFINNLPVRVRLDNQRTVREWLSELQEQLLELRQHEFISPLDIETWSGNSGPTRLFQSLVVFENASAEKTMWQKQTDLSFKLLSARLKTNYPLTLVAIPGERMSLILSYDSRRFDDDAVHHALVDTERSLSALIKTPGAMLSELPRLRAPAQHFESNPKAETIAGTISHFESAIISPRNNIELQLVKILEELLQTGPIDVTRNLFDYGGHSLFAARLTAQLQAQFHQTLPMSCIFEHPTIAGLAAYLRRTGAIEQSWSPLVALNKGGARPAFYCVHPIAGDVTVFIDLVRCFGDDQPFYGLQAPGIESGQHPLTSVEGLARLYINAIRQINPVGPYRIGGYSFGGVVAFEMARQLTAMGDAVAMLAVIDTPAPLDSASFLDHVDDDDALWLWRMVSIRERFHRIDLSLSLDDLSRLDRTQRRLLVLNRMRETGLLLDHADMDLLQRMITVSRAQYQAYLAYQPKRFDGSITLFRSEELDAMNAQTEYGSAFDNPELNWSCLSPNPIKVTYCPGDHITMMQGENARFLANALATHLDASERPLKTDV